MKQIKSNNTRPEVEFRKQFWKKGYRYRVNDSQLPGKPDIVFPRYKVAIFIDGEFWHGYKWNEKKERIKANRDYWIPKIESNIERDRRNTELLQQMGWTVFRFWEHEIKKNPEKCINLVLDKLKGSKESQ
jgi:DNA mismatch endonuclease (patch repair protein)